KLTVRSIADLFKIRKIFNRGIEDSVSSTNTGFSRTTCYFGPQTSLDTRRIRHSDPWGKILIVGRCERSRNAGISWKNISFRGTREYDRLQARHNGFKFVPGVIERWHNFITQPVI